MPRQAAFSLTNQRPSSAPPASSLIRCYGDTTLNELVRVLPLNELSEVCEAFKTLSSSYEPSSGQNLGSRSYTPCKQSHSSARSLQSSSPTSLRASLPSSPKSSFLQPRWQLDGAREQELGSNQIEPYVISNDTVNTLSSDGTKLSQPIPPTDNGKHVCPCVMGTCKPYLYPVARASHQRHEMSHWHRWVCRECHAEEAALLKEIDQPTPVIPQSPWLHLVENRKKKSDKTPEGVSVFSRPDLMTDHYTSAHQKSNKEARDLKERSVFKIKEVTACGICDEEVLFQSDQETEQHMWSIHWARNEDMTHWNEDRVIWKLLTLSPQLSQIWNVQIGIPFDRSNTTWQQSNIKKLRFELEVRRLSPQDLASMALRQAKSSEAAIGFSVSPQAILPFNTDSTRHESSGRAAATAPQPRTMWPAGVPSGVNSPSGPFTGTLSELESGYSNAPGLPTRFSEQFATPSEPSDDYPGNDQAYSISLTSQAMDLPLSLPASNLDAVIPQNAYAFPPAPSAIPLQKNFESPYSVTSGIKRQLPDDMRGSGRKAQPPRKTSYPT